MALDAEMEKILAAIPPEVSLEVGHLPLPEALARLRTPARWVPASGAPVETTDLDLEGPHGPIPIRIYRPATAKPLGIVLNFHGGGWVLGSIAHDEAHCQSLARQSDSVVVSVDYRLAPEHPYPQPLDDCYEATGWVYANRAKLGLPDAAIVVSGSSAGGNLAAAVAIKARDTGDFPIALQLLIYPICDCDFDTGSYRTNAEGYFLTRDSMMWFWDQYVPDAGARGHRYVSPAKTEDLTGVAPAHIVTAEMDPLCEEGEVYALKLAAAGVAATVRRHDGLVHGFLKLGPDAAWSRQTMEECAAAIRAAFAGA